MGFELRQFTTKSKFNKWFQKGKFRSYYRVRFGQLVIECRRIYPDVEIILTSGASPSKISEPLGVKVVNLNEVNPIVEFKKEDIEEVKQ